MTSENLQIPCCLNCANFGKHPDGRLWCNSEYGGGCITCFGQKPSNVCWNIMEWKPKDEHVSKPIIETAKKMVDDEEAKREAERLAETERHAAWVNRPKVKLKCKQCGTIQELGEEEYKDKRRRRKYEPTPFCEKCQNYTEHEWIMPKG